MRLRFFYFLICMLALSSGSAKAYESIIGPVGLLRHTEGKAMEGYTLFAPMGSRTTYLIDMSGNIVHTWKSEYQPGLYAELLPNGNLLRGADIPDSVKLFGGSGGLIEEFDWEGNKVWEYRMGDSTKTQHHTFLRIPNGNTLVLGWEYKSREEAIAKGRKPETLIEEGMWAGRAQAKIKDIWPDFVEEVTPEGKVVWTWNAWDHIGTGPNQLDINFFLDPKPEAQNGGPDWTHCNSLDYNPVTDQLLMVSRNFMEIWVIDRKSGEITWRWGNPSAYGAGKKPTFMNDQDQQLFGPHWAYWLPNGNIMVFDNGCLRPEGERSRAVEMDPRTGKVVWEFYTKTPNSFNTMFQGAAQKLPNGNVLITSTMGGHVFEVTQEKEVVWEMINPIGNRGSVCMADDVTLPLWIHRAYRYAPDYPGLAGKKLTPIGPMAPGCPDWVNLLQTKPMVAK